MKSMLNRRRAVCRDFQLQLEGSAPGAKEFSELVAAMPIALKEHAGECADCRGAAETFLEARALVVELPSHAAMGGPWFAPRVMATIAARKAESARVPETWTFLPKLAARLTWASAVALLLASGWLYQKPATHTTMTKSVATDITGDPVADSAMPANNDEVLVSLAEKTR